jgi:hypothetical protein
MQLSKTADYSDQDVNTILKGTVIRLVLSLSTETEVEDSITTCRTRGRE